MAFKPIPKDQVKEDLENKSLFSASERPALYAFLEGSESENEDSQSHQLSNYELPSDICEKLENLKKLKRANEASFDAILADLEEAKAAMKHFSSQLSQTNEIK